MTNKAGAKIVTSRPITKGSVFILTSGECDEYEIIGCYLAKSDFDLSEVCARTLEIEDPEWRFGHLAEAAVGSALIEMRLAELIENNEHHIEHGNNGDKSWIGSYKRNHDDDVVLAEAVRN